MFSEYGAILIIRDVDVIRKIKFESQDSKLQYTHKGDYYIYLTNTDKYKYTECILQITNIRIIYPRISLLYMVITKIHQPSLIKLIVIIFFHMLYSTIFLVSK